MTRTRILSTGILFLAFVVGLAACSKETPQPKTQQAAPAQQPAQQPTPQPSAQSQPAQTTTSAAPSAPAPAPATAQPAATATGKPTGPLATEKHSLAITNHSGTAVTVSMNGQWLGQWDSHANAPLDSVVQGKNELIVELQAEPKNTVQLYVNVSRAGQTVNLLRLNFQGKPAGTYNYTFVAR